MSAETDNVIDLGARRRGMDAHPSNSNSSNASPRVIACDDPGCDYPGCTHFYLDESL